MEIKAGIAWVNYYFIFVSLFVLIPTAIIRREMIENSLPNDHIIFKIFYNQRQLITLGLASAGFLAFVLSLE